MFFFILPVELIKKINLSPTPTTPRIPGFFMLKNNQLSPGVYRIKNESLTTECEELAKKFDQIRITEENSFPCDEVLGLPIYEAIHIKTQKRLYITTAEITK